MDHHVVGTTSGGAGDDEVEGNGDEDALEEEERSGDHCMSSVGLVDAHPHKVGLKAPKLVVNAREATCVQCPTMQQQLSAATSGCFHDDTSSVGD